jgi:hypothetical protein
MHVVLAVQICGFSCASISVREQEMMRNEKERVIMRTITQANNNKAAAAATTTSITGATTTTTATALPAQ